MQLLLQKPKNALGRKRSKKEGTRHFLRVRVGAVSASRLCLIEV